MTKCVKCGEAFDSNCSLLSGLELEDSTDFAHFMTYFSLENTCQKCGQKLIKMLCKFVDNFYEKN